MTADETPAELRARLNELSAAMMRRGQSSAEITASIVASVAFSNALVEAWPTIDALLARLTAAEADADRLSVDVKALIRRLIAHLEYPEVGIDGVTQMVVDDSEYDLRLYDEALALRERPQ